MAFSSIVSLLDNIDEKINISIIHNTKNLQQQIPLYIRDHKNLGSVAIYQFLENNDKFPNMFLYNALIATSNASSSLGANSLILTIFFPVLSLFNIL